MRAHGLPLLVAAAAFLAPASVVGTAHAGAVIVVDGKDAERVEDPFVPTPAQIDLGPAPHAGAAGTEGGAGKRRARAPGAGRGPGAARARAAGGGRAGASGHGPRAVGRALRRALASGAISRPAYDRNRRAHGAAARAWRRLAGARKAELGYVLRSLERLALAGRLTGSRIPVAFLQLRRNTAYWSSRPFPAAGAQVGFRGSELLFQYFPGRGLQFHPLANFKKANLLHGSCGRSGRGRPVCGARPPGPRRGAPCRPGRLRRLLDELSALAVRRGSGFVAWEYLFHFGGGSPPWMSGMAQATAITALGRGAQLLNRPDYHATAQAALGAFEARPPVGVGATGPRGGVHYLQYSFAPRLFIFNAFLQSLIGLHDYGRLARDPRATGLFRRAEPEAQREVPASDVGDWSRYSFRGRESTREYHELLREVLQGMGRRVGGIYCDYAIRYRGYQTQPPVLRFGGPRSMVAGRGGRVRLTLSKLSVVELKIYKGRRLVHRRLGTFRRGSRSFLWRPRSAGRHSVRLGAKELRTGRSLRGRATGVVTVERAPRG